MDLSRECDGGHSHTTTARAITRTLLIGVVTVRPAPQPHGADDDLYGRHGVRDAQAHGHGPGD